MGWGRIARAAIVGIVALLVLADAGSARRKPSLPGAPTLVSAVPAKVGVALQWTPPASDGGAAIASYRVYRGSGGAQPTPIATLGVVGTYTDLDVVPGTTYTYQVSAVNSVGEGPLSNSLSATAPGGSPPGLFQPYQAYSVGSSPDAVAVGDVTGDGRADVVMTTSYANDAARDFRLWVFAQASDGALLPPVSYPTAATYPNGPDSVAVGDITGDGRADVVLGVSGLGVQVFPQLADGTLGSPTLHPTADSNKIRLGRLCEGDRGLDVAGIGWGTNTVSVLCNDGSGGLAAPVIYPVQHAGYDDLEVGDVTGDGLADIVVMSGQGTVPNVSVVPRVAGAGFSAAVPYTVPTGGWLTHGIGVGDVTGDGRNDVVVSYGGNRPTSFVGVLAQSSGGLAGTVSYPSYDIPEPVDVADLNLDGRADVVVLHGGWNEAGVYLQQPDGTLGAEQLFPIPYASHYNPHGLAVGDVNGDGAPDVVLADYNNGLVVLRNTTRPPIGPPSAPTLESALFAGGSVKLTWSAPSFDGGSPVTAYRVYRSTSPGAETLLATVGAVTSYTDTGVSKAKTYWYRVGAVNAAGEGALSNELSTGRGH
jgi:hypothetical protein